jgi:hypothetical protein
LACGFESLRIANQLWRPHIRHGGQISSAITLVAEGRNNPSFVSYYGIGRKSAGSFALLSLSETQSG